MLLTIHREGLFFYDGEQMGGLSSMTQIIENEGDGNKKG
jgi:hypothetical protein